MPKTSSIVVEQAQLSADPTAPASGFSVIYPKTDGKWYYRNNSGSVVDLSAIVQLLTGFAASAGTVAATDSILVAFNKIVGNLGLKGDITSQTFVTPNLGVATATTINKVTITAPTTSATLTLVQGSSLITAGAFSITFTSTATTSVTLPTTGTLATLAGTETFTNKRLTPRVQAVTSSATVTANADTDDLVTITAQAAGLTLANPSGTPTQGQVILYRFKDNGTARTIAYGTQFRALGVTLPTTTVISKTGYLSAIYNSTDTKWDVVGYSLEA